MHPMLVIASKDAELTKERWVKKEPHDILVECSRVSLDPTEMALMFQDDDKGLLDPRPSSSESLTSSRWSLAAPPVSRGPSAKVTPIKQPPSIGSNLPSAAGGGGGSGFVAPIPISLPDQSTLMLRRQQQQQQQQQAPEEYIFGAKADQDSDSAVKYRRKTISGWSNEFKPVSEGKDRHSSSTIQNGQNGGTKFAGYSE